MEQTHETNPVGLADDPVTLPADGPAPERLETIKNLEAAFGIALDNPAYLAERFHRYVCETMDRSRWGGDPDPMVEAFTLANSKAPAEFYSSFSDSKRTQLLARSRNWIAALIKLRQRERVTPALDFLLKVSATDAEMLQSKMPPILRILCKGVDEVARKSGALAEKYHIDVATAPAPKISVDRRPSPPAPSEDPTTKSSIFALQSHRRPRVEKPKVQVLPDPPMPQPARPAAPAAAPAKHFALSDLRAQIGSHKRATPPDEAVVEVPPPKKAKSGKRVHWKDDDQLVQVRFFETDDLRHHMRSAVGAREMEMDEAAVTKRSAEVIPWTLPPLIRFDPNCFGDLRAIMGVSRGGLKAADSPEALAQQAREAKVLADFGDAKSGPQTPKEPLEPAEHEVAPVRLPPFKGIPAPRTATPPVLPAMPMNGMTMPSMMPPMGMPMMPVFPMGFTPDMMQMFNQNMKK